MPSAENISAPIVLVSYGRSGTSLLHKAFEARSDFDVVGESADLIFQTWYACELSKGVVRGDWPDRIGGRRPVEQRWADAVRSVFLSMFESRRESWFQKPIGMPGCINQVSHWGKDFERFYAWYWNVFGLAFPEARYFTILRNPLDVIVSAKKYWGKPEREIIDGLQRMAELMTHKDSKVEYAVQYDELVSAPETALKNLCAYLQIPFDGSMLSATKTLHVPTVGVFSGSSEVLDQKRDAGFSRRPEWAEIREPISEDFWTAIQRLWDKFGAPLNSKSEKVPGG